MITVKESQALESLVQKHGEKEVVELFIGIINNKDNTQIQRDNSKNMISVLDLINYYETLPKDSNSRCMVCHGSIRSDTTISKSESIHLIELAWLSRKDRNQWIMYSDITNSTDTHWGTKSTKGTQLELWKLIETSTKIKQINAPEVDGVKRGSQRLTERGYNFIQQKIKVFETVFKNQFGKPIGWSDKKIGIYDVRGQGTQLTEQMVKLHYKNRK